VAVRESARSCAWFVIVVLLALPVRAEVGFWWAPASPEAGEQVVFMITGTDEVARTDWDFGQPGCDGYPQLASCEPSPYVDCLSQPYQFAFAGDASVTLWVTVGSDVHGPLTGTVSVLETGACADALFADGFETANTSGWSAVVP